MKNPRSWLRTVILVACILSVTSCTITLSFCNPSNSYTLTWHPGVSGFPDVTLTLTPVIPPKALSLKPSDYVQVDLKADNFSFSTNDPAYQCLETIAATTLPIILAPENEVISGFAAINDFLIVYQACGQFVQTSHANLASRGGIAAKELIFFKITGQKMVSRAANGQELSPLNLPQGPTVTPSITPTRITPAPPPPLLSATPSAITANTDCSYSANTGWTCSATLSSTSNNQGDLNWSASSSGLQGISFSQPNGTLSPGASQQIQIFVSAATVCPASAGLAFSGPVNTVSISWSCAAPTLSVSPSSMGLRSSNCQSAKTGYTCTVTLNDDQGGANWTASSGISSVSISPSSGTVYPSGTTITISNLPCTTVTISFAGPTNTATASWTCIS